MQCTFSSYKKRLVKSHLRHGRHHHHKTYFGHCGYLWKSPAFAQVMWSGIPKKPTSSNSCAMITALPLTNLAIQNMFATFTTTLALEAQWRLQTNVSSGCVVWKILWTIDGYILGICYQVTKDSIQPTQTTCASIQGKTRTAVQG